ncbi:MAG: acyltransferase [Asticcacaulis sp.]|uniref:acyltransferase n=1 Tax=Asticcacaulis sp. TaxID=1872648 RepID=UPI0039E4F321
MSAVSNSASVHRLVAIDAMRFIAMLAIVIIHALPSDSPAPDWRSLLVHACRFAVPCFFLASGFFFASKISDIKAIKRQTVRLLSIYVLALIAYIAITPLTWFQWPDLHNPLRVVLFIIGGPAFHLWFLPTLVLVQWILYLLRPYGFGVIFAIGAVAYIFGLIIAPYHYLAHLPDLQLIDKTWQTISRPFSALLFVSIGVWLAERKPSIKLATAVLMTIGGLGLQMAESMWLYQSGFGTFNSVDFSIGTLFYGVGIFCLATLYRGPMIPQSASWGRLTLYMYVSHMFFLYILHPAFLSHAPLPSLTLCLLTSVFSLLGAWIFSRVKMSKFFSGHVHRKLRATPVE